MRHTCILLVILCLSCTAVRVQYDFDEQTNFTSYATYGYYPDLETGLSDFDEKRLLTAMDSVLQMKGYLLSDEPDFLINITASVYDVTPQNSVGVGLGGSGRNIGGGVSIGLPLGRSNAERLLQFDFVDNEKDQLFWQAISESTFKENANPETKVTQFNAIVTKVLSKYPPEKK